MPREFVNDTWLCELCSLKHDSREEAVACEAKPLDREPLPEGTIVLTSAFRHAGDYRDQYLVFETRRIVGWDCARGQEYDRLPHHQVVYRTELLRDEDPNAELETRVNARSITPHQPEVLNRNFGMDTSERYGDRLDSLTSMHGGSDRHEVISESLEMVDILLGRRVERGLWELAFYDPATNHHGFLMLAPQGMMDPLHLAAYKALARPLTMEHIREDRVYNAAHGGMPAYAPGMDLYRRRLDGGGPKSYPMPRRGALGIHHESNGWDVARGAGRLMAATSKGLDRAALKRSEAWWAGEDVWMPMDLLVSAPSRHLNKTQRARLEALNLEMIEIPYGEVTGRTGRYGLPEGVDPSTSLVLIGDEPPRGKESQCIISPRSALAALGEASIGCELRGAPAVVGDIFS